MSTLLYNCCRGNLYQHEKKRRWHSPLYGYVKAGYKIPDPSEGHMHCDVIVLDRNDV